MGRSCSLTGSLEMKEQMDTLLAKEDKVWEGHKNGELMISRELLIAGGSK